MSAVVAVRSVRAPVAAAALPRPAMARSLRAAPLRRASLQVRRAEPSPNAVEIAIKEAEEACDGGSAGECAAAWDEVEEISAAISHKKDAAKADPALSDPLEQYCAEDPSSPECKVFED